jgi:hypothetical protein
MQNIAYVLGAWQLLLRGFEVQCIALYAGASTPKLDVMARENQEIH